MTQGDLLNIQVQLKKIQNLLIEVDDLSLQLAEATDRGDEVALHMLLAMRREPINQMLESQKLLDTLQNKLFPQDADRLQELLQGQDPVSVEEKPLADQVAANQRLLKKVVDLDQRISQKLAGEDSFYARKSF